jgi:hypothetical protein
MLAVGCHGPVHFPVRDREGVLRPSGYHLAGDDIFARNRTSADLDPNLPINIEIAERKMLAFNSIDNSEADVLGINHILD